MTLAREHRGCLIDSMATARTVRDRADLIERIPRDLCQFRPVVTDEMIHIKPYCFDERIDWNCYIVTVDGYGVWGFTNGPER